MKVFLGILRNDVLQMDAGLSDVDPRKLAAGGLDEVVFVGELLCWLAKQRGLLPPETVETLQDVEDSSVLPKLRTRARSLSTRSTVTNSAHTNLSIQSTNHNSDTTIVTDSDSSGGSPVAFTSPSRQPRCIHELEESSLIPADDAFDSEQDAGLNGPSESFCNCFTKSSTSATSHMSIRYTGLIDTVDDSLELELFESTRGRNRFSDFEARSRSHSLDTTLNLVSNSNL